MKLKDLRFILIALGCLVGFESVGQFVNAEVKVQEVHYGMVGSYDLDGYITYDVCLNFTSPEDFLSAINGQGGCVLNDPLDSCDVNFLFDCDVFNHPLGGLTSSQLNPLLCPTFPALCYDSYLTIGDDLNGSCLFTVATCPTSIAEIQANWEADDQLYIDDGAVFTTNIDVCGVAGPDLQVKVAQFTTCGNWNGSMCIQVFVGGDGDNEQQEIVPFYVLDPCEANDLDPAITILDSLDCFGDCSEIQIGEGVGNGFIEYELWSPDIDPLNPLSSQTNDNVFCLPGNTDYFIAMVDSIGCRDTTNILNYFEPELLVIESSVTSDELCAGENAGSILNAASGGLTPYVFSSDQAGMGDLEAGQSWADLACVSPMVSVTDDNGCTDEVQFDIACPIEMVLEMGETTNISCFGYNNGELEGTLTGGTGVLTATWTCGLDEIEISGTSPLDIGMTDLGPCDYSLVIVDENNCQLLGLFSVEEPAEFSTVIVIDDASCYEFCDGSITVVATGGTPEITTTCAFEGGEDVPLVDLCAGNYVCTTIDELGCTIIDSVEVAEPPALEFNPVLTNVLCAGGADGTLLFENISGGIGDLDLEIDGGPIGLDALDPDTGFVDLPTGSYLVNFVDLGNDCAYQYGAFDIIEPLPIDGTSITTDITCFGAADGMVEIACGGGTGAIVITSTQLPDTIDCPGTIAGIDLGTYELILTDESNCEMIVDFTINEPELLTILITDTTSIVCGGTNEGAVEYEFSGGVGDYEMTLDDVPVTLFDLVQLYAGSYELCVFDENLCMACDSFTVDENPVVEIIANELNDASCTGMTNGSASLFVTGGVGDLTVSFDPESIDLNNLPEGSFSVFVVDSLGCEAMSIYDIGVIEESDMVISTFVSPVTCWNTNDGTATIAIAGGNDPIVIEWSDPMDQVGSTAVGLQEGLYFVNIVDDVGCTVDTMVTVPPNIGCFFIATAITPNGDGSNDEWVVGGLEYFPESTVSVINRWGQVIYESKGYTVPWDGMYNGQKVPVADYYYLINFNNERDPITGTVTVKY